MAFRQSILLINFWCLPRSLYYASASQLICFSCSSSKTLIRFPDIPTLSIDRDYTSAFFSSDEHSPSDECEILKQIINHFYPP